MRLADTARTVTYNLQALDQDGNPDASYTRDVQVYVQYLGTLTPYLGQTPLATVHVANGVAMNQSITLPPVFGPTSIWFDDGKDMDATYATGASPTLWYRDPYIQDIQKPLDETALDALSASPLQNKNLDVRQSRHGADGRPDRIDEVADRAGQGVVGVDVLDGGLDRPALAVAEHHD